MGDHSAEYVPLAPESQEEDVAIFAIQIGADCSRSDAIEAIARLAMSGVYLCKISRPQSESSEGA